MMKSVRLSGRNSSWLCVPSPSPLPNSPPEPIAIFDWMMFQPSPSGSRSGLRKVSMRPRWYSYRDAQSTGAAAATKTKAPVRNHQRTPARRMTAIPPAATRSPVPRSGCIAIKPAGTTQSAKATTRCQPRGGTERSCRYQATASGTASFIISEGWNRGSPGKSSQRVEPLAVTPMASTTSSSARPRR